MVAQVNFISDHEMVWTVPFNHIRLKVQQFLHVKNLENVKIELIGPHLKENWSELTREHIKTNIGVIIPCKWSFVLKSGSFHENW